jgi:hypothetical protein
MCDSIWTLQELEANITATKAAIAASTAKKIHEQGGGTSAHVADTYRPLSELRELLVYYQRELDKLNHKGGIKTRSFIAQRFDPLTRRGSW